MANQPGRIRLQRVRSGRPFLWLSRKVPEVHWLEGVILEKLLTGDVEWVSAVLARIASSILWLVCACQGSAARLPSASTCDSARRAGDVAIRNSRRDLSPRWTLCL